jgi:hypothetical protein
LAAAAHVRALHLLSLPLDLRLSISGDTAEIFFHFPARGLGGARHMIFFHLILRGI